MTEVRHTLEALLNPLFIVLLLMIVAMVFSWHILWAKRLLLCAVIVLFLFSTSFFPAYITKKLESVYPSITHYDPSIKLIVVLSGGQADVDNLPADLVLNTATIKRLLTGIRIWKSIPDTILVLSGGGYGHQIPEAIFMQNLAVKCGIPEDDIQTETQSLNTQAQAHILKKTLKGQSFYLVTSAIHMPRSMALFKENGLHPIAAPADFTFYWQDERWQKRYIPNAHNLVYAEIAMHEILGLFYHNMSKYLFKNDQSRTGSNLN